MKRLAEVLAIALLPWWVPIPAWAASVDTETHRTSDGGNAPGGPGWPDWGKPGQTWGPPPADWWCKAIDPDTILFPEYMPPGERELWLDHWKHHRVKGLHR